MKKRRKTDRCLNCDYPTGPDVHFCPQCGQENNIKRQPFWTLVYDAVTGFFSIDSRTFRSLLPLLFKPGFLTREFIAGRYVRYVHPARMFITIIILYFLLASMLTSSVRYPPEIKFRNESSDSSVKFMVSFGNVEVDYRRVEQLMNSGVSDPRQMADSLNLKNTLWNRMVLKQVMKARTLNFDTFVQYLKSRFSLVLFAIMPVFALIMKLVYVRRKILFLDHLVFAFHLHSFVFMILIVDLFLVQVQLAVPSLIWVFIILIYFMLALLNVYHDSWLKSFLRILLISLLYLIAGTLAAVFLFLILYVMY